jgi:Tat protein secretion system quality control protein TatD with DNase activity
LAAGVERIVTVGTNLPDCRKAVEIAHRHPSVYMPLSESIPTRPEPSTAKPTMS